MSEAAVFFSNDLGYLAKCLGQQLFSPSTSPFEKRLVIVPNQAMKRFIQLQWVKQEGLGIAAGVDIVEMPRALSILSNPSIGKLIPSSLELSLSLFQAATKLLQEGKEAVADLYRYLEGKEDRLFPLCEQLARLFLDYGKYGEEHLEAWLNRHGWQALLWRAVFENTCWTHPLEIFNSSATWETRPHLFGFSSLPPAFARFFKQKDAFFYLFSPCSQYWGDFISDTTRARQALSFQNKGVAECELADLESYIEQQHPLLANWGQAGRFLLEVLQTEEMLGTEHYTEKEGGSRLTLLQRSILNLDLEPCALEEDGDDSLRILSIPSRWREVETLLDSIKVVLERHAEDEQPLLPGDILVLAPDITVYLPYIHAFFGSEESQLSYAISGIERIRTSPLADAFRHLLELLEKRFDAKALLALFEMTAFRNKQQWKESDLAQITLWIEKAGITWGYNGDQRALITHAAKPLEERGSWSFGFDRLLFGLVCQQEALLPSSLPILTWTDADLFGQLVALVEGLQADVESLASKSKRSLAGWISWSQQLFDRYFVCPEEENWVQTALIRLGQSCAHAEQISLQYADFCRILDAIFHRRSGHTPNADLQAIRFASLGEGEVVPARVICLLGMEEGSYPRIDSVSSLAEMPLMRISRSSGDRYLFLEACLQAQDYFWISYINRSPEEKIDLMPSLVVQELCSWLIKYFLGCTSVSFVRQVPFLGISKESLAQFSYFSRARYEAAFLYYNPVKDDVDNANENLPLELPPDVLPTEEEIRLEDLSECLRNPLSFYFSKVLDFRLKKEEELDFEEEEFCLSNWEILSLVRQSISLPLDDVIAAAKQRGEFPIGEFEHVAYAIIQEKRQEICTQLEIFGLKAEDNFDVILSRCCDQPKFLQRGMQDSREGGKLLLPAWKVTLDERTFYLTGQITGLSSQGLICYTDDKPAQLFPYWPFYLVMLGHPDLQHIAPALIPVGKKNKKNEPLIYPPRDLSVEIRKLLFYYQKAKTLISPFLPKWLPDFFGPYEKLEKLINEDTNAYAIWLMQQQGTAYTKKLCELWRPYLQTTFRAFLEQFEKKQESADV